jgi:hypothetical protein
LEKLTATKRKVAVYVPLACLGRNF